MDIEKYLSNFFKGTKKPSLKAMQYFIEEIVKKRYNIKRKELYFWIKI